MRQRNNQKAENTPPYTRNTTADHAIDVLMLFNEQQPILTAEEVAERLGMSRSTTYRYLLSLRSYGLLEEGTGSGEFRLGPAVFQLARVARQGLGLSEIALPIMHELVAKTGETALLTRRSGEHVVCIEYVASPHSVRLSYERGHILSLHAGASAKIVLAYLKPSEIEAILRSAPLQRYTEHTVTDPTVLRAQLQDIRAKGYAVSDGEVDVGVRGVAAPILGTNKQIVAGISVAGPAFRLDNTVLPTILTAVQEAGHVISQRLRNLDV
jgi:DNA-binding IclR family transcriptional regulator